MEGIFSLKCINIRDIGVFRNEAKLSNSYALTKLHVTCIDFDIHTERIQDGIHALQIKHLKMKSPNNLREVEFAKEVWVKCR